MGAQLIPGSLQYLGRCYFYIRWWYIGCCERFPSETIFYWLIVVVILVLDTAQDSQSLQDRNKLTEWAIIGTNVKLWQLFKPILMVTIIYTRCAAPVYDLMKSLWQAKPSTKRTAIFLCTHSGVLHDFVNLPFEKHKIRRCRQKVVLRGIWSLKSSETMSQRGSFLL